MILYLYALADRVERLDGLAGVGGEPLLSIDAEGACLIAGWLAAPPAVERATLEAQDRAIRALHDRAAALLPIRFGTIAEGIDAAVRSVSIIARTLPERFELVRGREQMTVRATGAMGATGAAGATGAVRATGATGATGAGGALSTSAEEGAGTAYLRRRASQPPPAAIAQLIAATATLARATRIEPVEHGAVVATVYQLIDRGMSAKYDLCVRDAGRALPALTLRVSGPSPAYAFARE